MDWSSLETQVIAALIEEPNMKLRRKKIRDKIESKFVPSRYSLGSFPVVLQRALDSLCENGFLAREDAGKRRIFYYISKRKAQEIKEKLLRNENQQFFEKIPLKDLEKLRQSVSYYQRRDKIKELKKVPLPGLVILSKIHELGFSCDMFHQEKWTNVFFREEAENEELGIDTEVKIFSEKDLTLKGDYRKRAKIDKLSAMGWRLVSISESGYLLYSRYKVLGEMVNKQFNSEIEQWKELLNLPNAEWKKIEPVLRQFPPLEFLKKMYGL